MTLDYDRLPAAGAPATRHVLVLHGLGDSKDGWKDVVPMLGLPRLGWIFAEAPVPYGPGWSWFDLDWERDMAPDPDGVVASTAALRQLVGHLETAHRIPAEQLIVMGFSQGCLMTVELGLTHDRVFAGLIGISGWVFDLAGLPKRLGPAAKQQRLLMTHGRQDTVVPIALTRPQIPVLRDLGIAVDWREFDKAHGLDPDEELALLRERLADLGTCPE